jgi:ech hydrogenase subunit C
MSYVTKSPWIIHYDGSSCNGCDIEVLACLTPMYDVERFGIINTGNPKHADIFLVTGSVNEQNVSVVKQIYEQMPEPKVVVAIGICATSGGIFKECYNIRGGIDTVIPVDVYVPGCAARPEAIIDGVVKGLGVLAKKKEHMPAAVHAPIAASPPPITEPDGSAPRSEEDLTSKEPEIEIKYYGAASETDMPGTLAGTESPDAADKKEEKDEKGGED